MDGPISHSRYSREIGGKRPRKDQFIDDATSMGNDVKDPF